MAEEEVDIVEGEPCPFCHTNNLTLMERILEIPYFGVTHVFSILADSAQAPRVPALMPL